LPYVQQVPAGATIAFVAWWRENETGNSKSFLTT